MEGDPTPTNQDSAPDDPLKTPLKGSLKAFKRAMEHYRPDPIRLLFIAEAPPAYRTKRLFYFNGLETGDTLFLEMMKVIYGVEIGFTERDGYSPQKSAKNIRRRKSEFLDRFMADGYFLIDAREQPMPDAATAVTKLALLRRSLPGLIIRVKGLLKDHRVPIVLIGAVTYSACSDLLRKEGFYVANQELINHPARGGQSLFRKKLRTTLGGVRRK